MSSIAKNNILTKIRAALSNSTPLPFPDSEASAPLFQPLQQDIVVEFAEQFTQLQGKFAFCSNKLEAQTGIAALCLQNGWTEIYCTLPEWRAQLPATLHSDDIVNCNASITTCEVLVARTGTIVLSALNSGRITSVYAPVHICVAYTSQLVYVISDALLFLTQKYGSNLPSFISFATGPSRTADIEKTLVVGVHGPKEVYLFLIDDSVI